MRRLTPRTVDNITRVVGMDIERIKRLTPEEEELAVKKACGFSIGYSSKRRPGRIGRGNPLLARHKIRTFKDLDVKSKKLFGI